MNTHSIKPIFDSIYSKPEFTSDKTYNIVVIGRGEVAEKFDSLQHQYSFSLRVTTLEDANFSINRSTIAIVFDEEEIKNATPTRLNDILVVHNEIPKYYLSRTDRAPNFYGKLYASGMKGVISWAREAELLPKIIVESLKIRNDSEGVSEADERLAKIVKSHIQIVSPETFVNIKCVDGFVFIKGYTINLYDYEIVLKETNSVLGVKKIITKDFKVQDVDSFDEKELRSNLNHFANNTADGLVDLNYEFNDRVVIIDGCIESYSDLNNIENIIKKYKGVRKIIKNVTLTGELNLPVGMREKEIEARLKLVFKDINKLKVIILNDTIEIKGVAENCSTTEFIENMLLEVYSFKNVINKLTVKS